jgi:hypothetical protein
VKTCTYQNVQDQSAELAGRPRDKLPVSEALMLLNYIAFELKVMWNMQAWPELCDNLESLTPVNTNGVLTISKNEGTAGEIGDILWIGTADPRNTTGPAARPLRWDIGDGQIYLLSPACIPHGTVWLDWQLPPTDLLAVNAAPTTAQPTLGNAGSPATLVNTLLPARFLQPLSMKAAAKLLFSDGDAQKAATYETLAQQMLDWMSAQPEMALPSWRGVKIR